MKIIKYTISTDPEVTVKYYEPETLGEHIAQLMIMSGKWNKDNITEEQVSLLAKELLERFGVVDDEVSEDFSSPLI